MSCAQKRSCSGCCAHELLELSDQLRVTKECQVGVDATLDGGQPDLLQPLDRRLCEGLVREIGERPAAPERKRLAQELARAVRVAPLEQAAPLRGEALEAVQVELLGREAKDVSGCPGLEIARRTEDLPQLRDLLLHLRHRRDRRRSRVEIVRQPVDRYHAVRAQEKDRERRALLRPAQTERIVFVLVCDLERAENAELEHFARNVAGR